MSAVAQAYGNQRTLADSTDPYPETLCPTELNR